MMTIGQKVKMTEEACEHYNVSENEVFYIINVATSTDEHPGYDASMEGMALYDLKDENGEDFGSSLYEYELEDLPMNKFEWEIMEKGYLPAVSFPGSYPIYYIGRDGSVSCAKCAEEHASEIEAHECYMEGAPMTCEGCNCEIESAYGDPDEEDEDDTVGIDPLRQLELNAMETYLERSEGLPDDEDLYDDED